MAAEQTPKTPPETGNLSCLKCKNPRYRTEFCKACFCELVERKVKKYLRENQFVKKGDRLAVKDPLCRQGLLDAIQGLPVELVEEGKDAKQVLPLTMDDTLDVFFDKVFYGNEGKIIPQEDQNIIALFRMIKARDVEAYAKAKKLPFTLRTTKYTALLDVLEKNHQETRTSVLNSIDELKEILEKAKEF